jgi:hypothetical protein
MRKFLLALVAMALVATMVSSAEAGRGRYGRPVVSYGWGGPVVVAPRYYRPVYVGRPYYYSPYRYGYVVPRTGVYVHGGYFGGGQVIVRTPGFGLNVHY